MAAVAAVVTGYDSDKINDLCNGVYWGTYRTLKSVTTWRYRNGGQNSGWYVDKVEVVGVKW